MDLRTVINWAPYPAGTPRSHQQFMAVSRFVEHAPSWAELVLCVLPTEEIPEVVVDGQRCDFQKAILPRDAFGDHAGQRHLPYVKDVMDLAAADSGDDAWCGFLNSDIIVTPEFFTKIAKAPRSTQIILVHRTDIRKYDVDPKDGQKVNQNTCTDGFFIRRGLWQKERAQYPDFILGEPWWDTGTIFWSKAKELETLRLIDNECLHICHSRYWARKSLGATYNSMLGKHLWKSMAK